MSERKDEHVALAKALLRGTGRPLYVSITGRHILIDWDILDSTQWEYGPWF